MERQTLIDIYGEPGQNITNGTVFQMFNHALSEGLGSNLPADWLKLWTDRSDVCTATLRVKIKRMALKMSKLRGGARDKFMDQLFQFPEILPTRRFETSFPISFDESEPSTSTSVSHLSTPVETMSVSQSSNYTVSTSPTPVESTSISETQTISTQSKSPLKKYNLMLHNINRREKTLLTLNNKITKAKEELSNLSQRKGHFAIKNVKKREDRSRLIRKEWKTENCKLKKQVKEQESEIRTLREQLLSLKAMERRNVNQERRICELEKGKRRAEKRASYYQREKARILKEVPKEEGMAVGDGKREIVTVQQGKYTKVYNEKMRMCVMELAGLEVATGKIADVIKCVAEGICDTKCSHLPSRQACQNMIDEGQFIMKKMFGEKLKECTGWGVHKDGTTRKAVKILETSIQTDDGSSYSLGFSSVVSETGEAIAEDARQKIGETSEAVGEEGQRKELLMKMTYFMNDRAANEKKSSRLLEEWREQALKEEGEEKAPEVFHLFCMAHVLLGFHSYTIKHLDFGSEQLKHPIAVMLRDAADIFGPVGDYRGMRNVWLAYCKKKGVQSFIQNYKDNRFNGLFEVAAQVFFHHKDFLLLLTSKSSMNAKQTRLLKALQDQNLLSHLECLGLFFFKITGPFWTLATSPTVHFSSLPSIIQNLEKGLTETAKNPSLFFLENTFGLKSLETYEIIQNKCATSMETTLMGQIIQKICHAFLDTINAQLSEFLSDGQFGSEEGSRRLEKVSFAPLNNLMSERNFGLLDASQKRRPNASLHHHSSIVMLKQNQKGMRKYISSLPSGTRKLMWARAMVMGKTLRKRHRAKDMQMLQDCLPSASKTSRRKGSMPPEISFPDTTNVREGDLIAVACEEQWFPAVVLDSKGSEKLKVDFGELGKGLGSFKWPSKRDIHEVSRKSVLAINLEVEPRAGGRSWMIMNAKAIQDKFQK